MLQAWSGAQFLETVQGTTDQYPPIRVMFLAYRLKASGVVTIHSAHHFAELDMQNGKICGCVGIPDLLSTVGIAGEPGDDLFELLNAAIRGGVPPEAALRAAADGVGNYLAWTLGLTDASINYKLDATMIRTPMALPVSIPQIIAGGLHRARPGHLVRAELQPKSSHAVEVHRPADAPEAKWGLNAVAMRLLRDAEGARSLRSLTRAGRSGVSNAEWQAIDLLHQMGLIELVPAKRSRGQARKEPSQASREVDVAVKLETALRNLRRMEPWQVLELTASNQLNSEGLNQALREVSSRYHPDLFSAYSNRVTDLARSCFEQVMAAFNRFEDDAFREEVKGRLDAAAKGEKYVSAEERKMAEMAFRRGQVSYRRKDYAAAQREFQTALRLDPKPWRYTYMFEVASYYAKTKPGTVVAQNLTRLVAGFGVEKNEDPKLDKAMAEVLFDAAEILMAEQAEYRTAIKLYSRVLRLDPTHHGAHRRIRLHKSRVETARSNQESPGLLGRLTSLFGSRE